MRVRGWSTADCQRQAAERRSAIVRRICGARALHLAVGVKRDEAPAGLVPAVGDADDDVAEARVVGLEDVELVEDDEVAAIVPSAIAVRTISVIRRRMSPSPL